MYVIATSQIYHADSSCYFFLHAKCALTLSVNVTSLTLARMLLDHQSDIVIIARLFTAMFTSVRAEYSDMLKDIITLDTQLQTKIAMINFSKAFNSSLNISQALKCWT